MGVKEFLDEEQHPTMFTSLDGKIGRVYGVSFVRTHVYVREPRWHIPATLWYWLADRLTHRVSETVTDMKPSDPKAKTKVNSKSPNQEPNKGELGANK